MYMGLGCVTSAEVGTCASKPTPTHCPPRPLPQITDAVYMGLGRVLTISGRTIRPEAQASPQPAAQAEEAISVFLQKVRRGGAGQGGGGGGGGVG